MFRRDFLCRLAGMLGGLVGLGVEGLGADVRVTCPYCGNPSMPRRRCKDATEYVCFKCPDVGELPLGAFMFTRKANDPNYYAFFPPDVERAFR
jgi:hypothetical protein